MHVLIICFLGFRRDWFYWFSRNLMHFVKPTHVKPALGAFEKIVQKSSQRKPMKSSTKSSNVEKVDPTHFSKSLEIQEVLRASQGLAKETLSNMEEASLGKKIL